MIPDDPIFHKPKSFIAAKNLLYASVFLSLIIFVIHNLQITVRSNSMVLGWCIASVGYAAMIILIKQMGLCKKWARTVLTIWYSISLVSVVISFFSTRFNMSIPEVAIWVLKVALQMIAFVFLYSKDCENWFNSKKYEMFQK